MRLRGEGFVYYSIRTLMPKGSETAPPSMDFDLLDAWRAGDRSAGNALFRRHFDSVCRFFRAKVALSLVEDLVQETFLSCLESRDDFRKQSSFRTFLFCVARRRLYDHFRRKQGNPVDFMASSIADLGASPSQDLARRQEQRLLLLALRTIPVDQQIALELYYWEGMEGHEIAEILGISPHTARSRLHRARQALREALERHSSSQALLESTLSDLDGWARGLAGVVDRAAG